MLLSSMPHSATVIRPGTRVDGRGDTVVDFSSATRFTVAAMLQVRNVAERESAERSILSSDFALYFAPNTDVRAGDRVEINGGTYTVEGDPYSPAGIRSVGPTHAALKRVEG